MAATDKSRTRTSRAAKKLEEARTAYLEPRPWLDSPAYANTITTILRVQAFADSLAKTISSRGMLTKAGEPKKIVGDYLALSERLRVAEASLPPPPASGTRPLVFSVNGAVAQPVAALSDDELLRVDAGLRAELAELEGTPALPIVDYFAGDRLASFSRLLVAGVCDLINARPDDDVIGALGGAIDSLANAEEAWTARHPALPASAARDGAVDTEQEEAGDAISGTEATEEAEAEAAAEVEAQPEDPKDLFEDPEEVS